MKLQLALAGVFITGQVAFAAPSRKNDCVRNLQIQTDVFKCKSEYGSPNFKLVFERIIDGSRVDLRISELLSYEGQMAVSRTDLVKELRFVETVQDPLEKSKLMESFLETNRHLGYYSSWDFSLLSAFDSKGLPVGDLLLRNSDGAPIYITILVPKGSGSFKIVTRLNCI